MTIYLTPSGAPFTNWYDEVLPYVPGCLEAIALNAIQQAATEFCERTWAMNGDHDPISSVADQASYDYVPPANKLVVKVLEAWYSDEPITPKAPDQLRSIYGRKWQEQTGLPMYYTSTEPRSIILVPYPAEAVTDALTMRVAFKPTPGATTIDTQIWEEYHEEIAAGARYRLMLMPKKPYTNVQQAAIEKARYDDGIAEVKHRVQRGFNRSRSNTRAHFF